MTGICLVIELVRLNEKGEDFDSLDNFKDKVNGKVQVGVSY